MENKETYYGDHCGICGGPCEVINGVYCPKCEPHRGIVVKLKEWPEHFIREHCNTEFDQKTGEELVHSSIAAVEIAMQEYAAVKEKKAYNQAIEDVLARLNLLKDEIRTKGLSVAISNLKISTNNP